MQVEVWFDFVCPWCYIGKRRLEKAIAAFDHAGEVEVIWRSFQLDPSFQPASSSQCTSTWPRRTASPPLRPEQC